MLGGHTAESQHGAHAQVRRGQVRRGRLKTKAACFVLLHLQVCIRVELAAGVC